MSTIPIRVTYRVAEPKQPVSIPPAREPVAPARSRMCSRELVIISSRTASAVAQDKKLRKQLDYADSKPLVLGVTELEWFLDELIYTLTYTSESEALAAGAPIARALSGGRNVSGPYKTMRLLSPDEVAELAKHLATLREDVGDRYTDSDEVMSRVDPGELEETAARVEKAYRRAAAGGHAMVIRY